MHHPTHSAVLSIIAAIATTAYATPTPTKTHLAPRSAITTFCGEDDLAHAADYLLYNNLWGKDEATSGSQCTYLEYDEGDTISWLTSWNWTGNSDEVKSYSNAVPNWDATQLSSIKSIKSSWRHDVVADVSYDAFISSSNSTTASHSYEVMIWLAQIGGAAPLGNSNGTIETDVSVEDISWDLYKGTNKGWTVFSFVASSDQNDFEGDVNEFFSYLIDNHGLPSDHFLQTIGAGAEAFNGTKAWFTVSPYNIALSAE